MFRAAPLIVAAVLAAALVAPADSSAASQRCSPIVLTVNVMAKNVTADGVNCTLAHRVIRGNAARKLDGAAGSRNVYGFACDLVSDRQVECDRGRATIGFDEAVPPGALGSCSATRSFEAFRRAKRVSCAFAVNLLRSAYGRGPLRILRTKGETVVLARGWRCSEQGGRAACWNVRRRSLNPLPAVGDRYGYAVVARARR